MLTTILLAIISQTLLFVITIVSDHFVTSAYLKVAAVALATAIGVEIICWASRISTILILLTFIKALQWRITPIEHLVTTARSALIVVIAIVTDHLDSSKAEYGLLAFLMATAIADLTVIVGFTNFWGWLFLLIFKLLIRVCHQNELV